MYLTVSLCAENHCIVLFTELCFIFSQVLAEHAEEHIEDTNPPLFLRFINLLINDAIFLLDEAIQVSFYTVVLAEVPLA